MVGFWPVTVVPIGRMAAATVLWRSQGRLHVTVVVKARFHFEHNGVMSAMMPEPLRPQLGELAPYLGQADVVVVAARAHGGDVAGSPRAVRLALFREWAVIDKSLLVYPRAASAEGNVIVSPNGRSGAVVVQPARPDRAASLGPLGELDGERVALLAGAQPPKPSAGVLEIGEMFPWAYYQVAPPDQRTTFLRGDEWLVLDGMHASEARLQSRLPAAHAVVRVYPPGLVAGKSYQVAMQADQLSINVERLTCSMLWRGSFAVSDVAAARALTLVAGVALPGQPPAWPDREQLLQTRVVQARFELGTAAAAGPRAVDPTVGQGPAEAYADTEEPKVPAAGGKSKPHDQGALDARAAQVAAQLDGVAVTDATTLLFDDPPPPSAEHAALALSPEGILSLSPAEGDPVSLSSSELESLSEDPEPPSEERIKTEPMPGRFPIGRPKMAEADPGVGGTVRVDADEAAQYRPRLAQVDVSLLLQPAVPQPTEAAVGSAVVEPRSSHEPPGLAAAKVDELEWTLSRSLAQLESEGESEKLAELRRLIAAGRQQS